MRSPTCEGNKALLGTAATFVVTEGSFPKMDAPFVPTGHFSDVICQSYEGTSLPGRPSHEEGANEVDSYWLLIGFTYRSLRLNENCYDNGVSNALSTRRQLASGREVPRLACREHKRFRGEPDYFSSRSLPIGSKNGNWMGISRQHQYRRPSLKGKP